jgi:hypothetical protein
MVGWIVSPCNLMLIPNCNEDCSTGDPGTCHDKCSDVGYGCQYYTQRICNQKDCSSGDQYECSQTVSCTSLTCTSGGYICNAASCAAFYGSCAQTIGP